MSEQALKQDLQQQVLDAVEQSPKAVAIHDKQAWLSIFAKYHAVEDPIGSTPHFGGLYDPVTGERGDGALDRFYDTFIAPNQIEFEVKKDTVCGQHVVRDLTVHIQMSDSLKASVPMHLLYELIQEGGEEGSEKSWKIQRLAAHWELMPMMAQIIGKGFACAPILFSLTIRMIKLQKLSGILGFCKAVFTIGNDGKESVQRFIKAVNENDEGKASELFCDINARDSLVVAEKMISLSEWLKKGFEKVELSKIIVAGSFVSASCSLRVNGEEKLGVVFFEFNTINRKIRSVKFYI